MTKAIKAMTKAAERVLISEEMPKVDAILEDHLSTGDGNYKIYTWEQAVADRVIESEEIPKVVTIQDCHSSEDGNFQVKGSCMGPGHPIESSIGK